MMTSVYRPPRQVSPAGPSPSDSWPCPVVPTLTCCRGWARTISTHSCRRRRLGRTGPRGVSDQARSIPAHAPRPHIMAPAPSASPLGELPANVGRAPTPYEMRVYQVRACVRGAREGWGHGICCVSTMQAHETSAPGVTCSCARPSPSAASPLTAPWRPRYARRPAPWARPCVATPTHHACPATVWSPVTAAWVALAARG